MKIQQVELRKKYPQYKIGRGSYGDLTVVPWDKETTFEMGAFCSVAAGVAVHLGGEHRTDWVTTFPFNVLVQEAGHLDGHPVSRGKVTIGSDVWLGTQALIMSGVTIGDGAVVGARAVVTKDIEPYAIYAGNPAKFVRKRFDDEVINDLLELRWWDLPDPQIEELLPLLLDNDIRAFITEAGRKKAT